jgi:hypothetical protein
MSESIAAEGSFEVGRKLDVCLVVEGMLSAASDVHARCARG